MNKEEIINAKEMDEMRDLRENPDKQGSEITFPDNPSRQQMRAMKRQFDKMDFRTLYQATKNIYGVGYGEGYDNGFVAGCNHATEVIQEALREELGIGEKRFQRVVEAVNKKLAVALKENKKD